MGAGRGIIPGAAGAAVIDGGIAADEAVSVIEIDAVEFGIGVADIGAQVNIITLKNGISCLGRGNHNDAGLIHRRVIGIGGVGAAVVFQKISCAIAIVIAEGILREIPEMAALPAVLHAVGVAVFQHRDGNGIGNRNGAKQVNGTSGEGISPDGRVRPIVIIGGP